MSYKFKIGIPGWSLGENSFGVTKPYLNYFSRFGSVIMLTPDRDIEESLDLVVLPGGKDTLSTNYDQPPGYFNSDADPFKEYFMANNFKKYVEIGIPVFGICLGFQQIMVHYGAPLMQNIDLLTHGYNEAHERSKQTHDLIFGKNYDWLEAEIKQKFKIKKAASNSMHHQAVHISNVPDCMNLVCSTTDKIVEVIEHKEIPIAGCQFHPEEDSNPVASHFIKKLLRQSQKYINYEAEYQGVQK